MSKSSDAAPVLHGPVSIRFIAGQGTALALVAFLALALLPVWLFSYVPTLDGPVHLYIAEVLSNWAQPGLPRLHQIFGLNIRPEPNWTVYILLRALLRVAPIGLTERLILTLYVAAMPLSILLFTRIVGENDALKVPPPATLLIFIFIYNATLFFGFYNFDLSLPLFIIGSGIFLKYIGRPTVGRAAILAGLSALTYVTHVMGWAALAVTAGTVGVWHAAACKDWEARVPLLAIGAAPFVPTLALMVLFLGRNSNATLAYASSEGTLPDRLRWFASLSVLYGNTRVEAAFIAVAAAVAVFWGVRVLQARRRAGQTEATDSLLAAVVTLIAAALAIPNMLFGGGYTAIRIQIFPFVLVALWLACNTAAIGTARASSLILGSAICGLLVTEVAQVGRMSAQFAQVMRAGASIVPDRTILPVVFAARGVNEDGHPTSTGIAFLQHVYARIAAEHLAIPLRVHQTHTLNFPLLYRAATDPYRYLPAVHTLQGNELGNPQLLAGLPAQIESYEAQTGQAVDYVLLVGTAAPTAGPAAAVLEARLSAHYAIATSEPGPPGWTVLSRIAP